jgi:Tol biopolymer transport system component
MATGRKAFQGASQASLIAAVLEHEPAPISSIQPLVPPALERVVKICLAKNPEDRWQTAHDLKAELEWIGEAGSQSGAPAAVVSGRKRRERLAWIGVAVATLAALFFAVGNLRRAVGPSAPIQASLPLPENTSLQEMALSPDGHKLAFTAAKPGDTPALWVRTLNAAAAQPVSGVPEAYFPFWSPDGKFIAFFAGGKLFKVDSSGGPVLTICDAERGVGGSWNREGTIVFAPTPTGPIYRVPASGGQTVAVTKLDASRHETAHRYPFFLPDGRHFLYMAANLAGRPEDPASAVRIGSLDGKVDRSLVPLLSNASYASGKLFYVRDGTLLAQPLDPDRLELSGEPVPIAPRVGLSSWQSLYQFSASEDLLTYAPAHAAPSELLWLDHEGRPNGRVGQPGLYTTPRLSPDGKRVAVVVFNPEKNVTEIWIYDVATGEGTKFAYGTWNDYSPIWSPQGDRILFASEKKAKGVHSDLWIKALDGSQEELYLESPDGRFPEDWSGVGRSISFSTIRAEGTRNAQLWTVGTQEDHKTAPIATEALSQGSSRFSPDGRWIAYGSDESGKFEVYVRPFPGPGGRWQVSTSGGSNPRWRGDGKELYYLSLDNTIMAVPVSAGTAFQAGAPRVLFPVHPNPNPFGSVYDVSPDGKRFLVDSVSGSTPPLTLLVHWPAASEKND